ncbi:hypothetical protein OS493_000309 [Desmophyllum pertusum]|uniref:Uncharacterized protein n=1 Tax=Desmophyllum pertusum TaxID=174260 RepID=A0A9X0A753_9CNID|nr:hypothetical protein OS493_000309 [Desmophyllum pertusum]
MKQVNAEQNQEWFNYLTTFQVDRVSQMTHWSLLHANQPAVPEATPAPGFERLMCLPQNVDQKITANKPGKNM